MQVEVLYLIGALAVISIIVAINVYRKSQKQENGEISYNFRTLYDTQEFIAIKSDSNDAGKCNVPFIDGDNIVETMENGSKTISTLGNIFVNIGDCNEKPIW